MKSRLYTFLTGVQQSAQPDAGTPTNPSDIVPLNYFGTIVESEAVSGTKDNSNTAFTVAHTPLAAWPFVLRADGVKLTLGTHYTRAGTAITIVGGVDPAVRLEADYRY